MYISIHIYNHLFLARASRMSDSHVQPYIYVYIYLYLSISISIYIYIYIYIERERCIYIQIITFSWRVRPV